MDTCSSPSRSLPCFMERACPNPTFDELSGFYKGDRNAVMSSATATTVKTEYALGDGVQVCRGQLKGVIGLITDMNLAEGWVKIATKNAETQADLIFRAELSDIAKYFPEGTHISVTRGPHEGDTGTVTFVRGESLVYLTDSIFDEREVLCNDCRKTNMSVGGKHTMGTWRLFDLVLLSDNRNYGCIVQLQNDLISVLTQDNIVVKVKPSNIRRATLPATKMTIEDRFHNSIHREDMVIVCADAHVPLSLKGKCGKVTQLFNDTLFAVAADLRENLGLFAVRSKGVSLVGGKAKARISVSRTPITFPPPRASLPSGSRCRPHASSRRERKLESADRTVGRGRHCLKWKEIIIACFPV